MPITELLYQFKQKQLTPQDISQLLSKMKELQVNNIPLWRISSLTRLITSTARLQGFLVIFAGLLFIPAAIYDKYTEDNSKMYRLAAYTPIAVGFVLAPMLLYRRSAKRLLNSIQYNLADNNLLLQTYKNQNITVAFNNLQLKYNPQKPKILHQITVLHGQGLKSRTFKIEGYGDWQSSEIFKHIIDNGGLRDQL